MPKCPSCGRKRPDYRKARRCYFDHVRDLPAELRSEVHRGRLSLAEAQQRAVHDPVRTLVLE